MRYSEGRRKFVTSKTTNVMHEQNNIDPNAPAFPRSGNPDFSPQSGITIFQHFSLELMKGVLSGSSVFHPKEAAKYAVEHAQALIDELNKLKK